MPRLPTTVTRIASTQKEHIGRLLKQTGDLNSAHNELRWLAEHAARLNFQSVSEIERQNKGFADVELRRKLSQHATGKVSALEALVRRRASGEPLQYIIGNQPFGELDIICEPNVLIPRPETETWSTNLANYLTSARIVSDKKKLGILDICSGSGAIALNLHQLLRQRTYPRSTPASQVSAQQVINQKPMDLQIMGIDVSEEAISLSERNKDHNIAAKSLTLHAVNEVCFKRMDVLKMRAPVAKQELSNLLSNPNWTYGKSWDVLVANPPYIAPDDYAVGGRTEGSVRDHEPRLALVPPSPEGSLHPGDTFYPKLLQIAQMVSSDLIVLELGDDEQAARVRDMVIRAKLAKQGRLCIETWYDDELITVHTDYEGKELPRPLSVRKIGDTFKQTAEKPAHSARVVAIWRQSWATRRMVSHKLEYDQLKKSSSGPLSDVDKKKARKVYKTEIQNSIRRSKRKAAAMSYAKSLKTQGNKSKGQGVALAQQNADSGEDEGRRWQS
jgi:HemK-like putative methylase